MITKMPKVLAAQLENDKIDSLEKAIAVLKEIKQEAKILMGTDEYIFETSVGNYDMADIDNAIEFLDAMTALSGLDASY